MNLRELITERIHFAVTEEELLQKHHVRESDLREMSDLDLFELYEDVCGAQNEETGAIWCNYCAEGTVAGLCRAKNAPADQCAGKKKQNDQAPSQDAQDAKRWRFISDRYQVSFTEGKFTSLNAVVSEAWRDAINKSVDKMMAGDWSDAATSEGQKP